MDTAAQPPESEVDVCVVGGGIVGLATARALLRREPDRSLVVVERDPDIGGHQTRSNSGVIHAGIYYAPGSLKARLCVEGAARLVRYCEERGIRVDRCGKVIVATRTDELGRLDDLHERGLANGVPGLRRLDAAGLAELEPNVRGLAALHSPATAIVDFAEVARAYAADVGAAGGSIVTGLAVEGIQERGRGVAVGTRDGEIRARGVVACAGAWSDRLAVASGADPDPRIVPFRGGYLRLRPERRDVVGMNVYPVPDPSLPFLGMHVTPTVSGEVLLGPSALLVAHRAAPRPWSVLAGDLRDTLAWPGTWRMAARWWRTGLREMRLAASRRAFSRELRRYVPSIGHDDCLPGPAGIRAQAVARDGRLVDDFVVSRTPRAIHVRNAPSPAATSSLALADLIADRFEEEVTGT